MSSHVETAVKKDDATRMVTSPYAYVILIAGIISITLILIFAILNSLKTEKNGNLSGKKSLIAENTVSQDTIFNLIPAKGKHIHWIKIPVPSGYKLETYGDGKKYLFGTTCTSDYDTINGGRQNTVFEKCDTIKLAAFKKRITVKGKFILTN